jgi:hypothetical protein
MKKRGKERYKEGLQMLRQGIAESKITLASERVGQDFKIVQDVLMFYPMPIAQASIDELVEFFNTNYQK